MYRSGEEANADGMCQYDSECPVHRHRLGATCQMVHRKRMAAAREAGHHQRWCDELTGVVICSGRYHWLCHLEYGNARVSEHFVAGLGFKNK